MKYNDLLNKFRPYLNPVYAKALAWQLAEPKRVSSCMLLGKRANQNKIVNLLINLEDADTFAIPNITDKDLKRKISIDVIRHNRKMFIVPDLSRVTSYGQAWLAEFIENGELNNGVFHDLVKGVKLIFASAFNDKKSLDEANHKIPCIFNQLYLERRLRKVATIKSILINKVTAYIDCN